jgi:hypothetical protein
MAGRIDRMMPLVRFARALDKGHPAFVNRLAQARETTPQNTVAAALPGLMGVEMSARDRALIFLELACNVVAYTAQRIGCGPDFSSPPCQ